MDCFARVFEHSRSRRRRPGHDRETLSDWAVICDDIICSSQAGTLKSENPQAFFGPWLTSHWVSFTDALLIDDRADNCAAFTGQGGTAIRWKMGSNDLSEITSQLRQWLDEGQSAATAPVATCAATGSEAGG